jgi:hypothetical protein
MVLHPIGRQKTRTRPRHRRRLVINDAVCLLASSGIDGGKLTSLHHDDPLGLHNEEQFFHDSALRTKLLPYFGGDPNSVDLFVDVVGGRISVSKLSKDLGENRGAVWRRIGRFLDKIRRRELSRKFIHALSKVGEATLDVRSGRLLPQPRLLTAIEGTQKTWQDPTLDDTARYLRRFATLLAQDGPQHLLHASVQRDGAVQYTDCSVGLHDRGAI